VISSSCIFLNVVYTGKRAAEWAAPLNISMLKQLLSTAPVQTVSQVTNPILNELTLSFRKDIR
jgi:hypothetical protein